MIKNYSIVAYEEGRSARLDGSTILDNPYFPESFDNFHSWNLGWNGFPPDAYQMLALETWHNKDVPKNEQINHAMLQLAAECGEVVKLWAKHLYKPAHEITREKVLDELGDLWYYVRIVAFLHDITIDELTQYNHDKLVGGHGWDGSSEKVNKRINVDASNNHKIDFANLKCVDCGMNPFEHMPDGSYAATCCELGDIKYSHLIPEYTEYMKWDHES